MSSAELSDANTADGVEVLAVAGDEPEPVFESGRCDKRVGKPCPELSNDPAGSLGDGAVDVKLAERREELRREIGCGVASEQLGTRHHRVAETVALRPELARASQVVDEDVGVDEEVSHVASRRATGLLRRVLLRTWR